MSELGTYVRITMCCGDGTQVDVDEDTGLKLMEAWRTYHHAMAVLEEEIASEERLEEAMRDGVAAQTLTVPNGVVQYKDVFGSMRLGHLSDMREFCVSSPATRTAWLARERAFERERAEQGY